MAKPDVPILVDWEGVKDYLDMHDIVEVVRCEDCKRRDADDFCTGRGYPNMLVSDDGFCDKGERKEE